ncbi:MAG: low specificity L-threonine aldolase [Paracoccaceae bacterium]
MFFASDNAGPVHPQILQALVDSNVGYAMPYGADPIMETVRSTLRAIFEAPDAVIYLVATGTAANALALGTLSQPWQTIFCAPMAHIQEDECNAPEFYTGGTKLTLVPGGDKMDPDALAQTIAKEETRGVHGAQRGPVSITQVTERGGVYSLDQLNALCRVAKSFDCPVHLDGARFANAQAALGCSAAEMTWKAGVDVVSFGATKNGAMGVEAVIFFDPKHAWEFELRRKRGAHLFSKHRYLSAQMQGYLDQDLWLCSAQQANAAAARLASGLQTRGATLLHPAEANMIFCSFPRAVHQRLHDAGAKYYIWEGSLAGEDPDAPLSARLVCDWSVTDAAIAEFLSYV